MLCFYRSSVSACKVPLGVFLHLGCSYTAPGSKPRKRGLSPGIDLDHLTSQQLSVKSPSKWQATALVSCPCAYLVRTDSLSPKICHHLGHIVVLTSKGLFTLHRSQCLCRGNTEGFTVIQHWIGGGLKPLFHHMQNTHFLLRATQRKLNCIGDKTGNILVLFPISLFCRSGGHMNQ